MHTAAAPSVLLQQIANGYQYFAGTLLLDDCDATFGKSRMNVRLQGLFTVRFQNDARFITRVQHYDNEYLSEYSYEYSFDDLPVFFPTAFAGNGRLHPCLAERSILIALEPKNSVPRCQPKKPGSTCQPFRFFEAQNQSRSLHFNLGDWGAANHELFEKIAPYKEDQFPPELSWRHRDCAGPLLQVADFIGGDWPQRARQALVNAFALAAFEDFYSSRQVLSDIRDLFAATDNPEWIATTDLLEFLHTLDNRIWDTWSKDKPMQPKALAHLLEPFGIQPRNHRTGPKTVPKGYYREDLEPIWRRHLEPWSARACPEAPAEQPAQRCSPKGAPGYGEGSEVLPVAANVQNLSPAISGQQLEASSQKPTRPVAAKSAQSTNNQVTHPATRTVAANPQNLSPAISGRQPDPVLRSQPKEASSQKLTRPVAVNLQNSIPSNPNQAASQPKEPAVRYRPRGTAITTVAASLQNSVPNYPKPGANSQKLAASPSANPQNSIPGTTQPATSRPMWGADWTNTPPPTHFAGNVKKEGIGYRILKKTL
jgi:hypothetical protein